MKEFRRKRRTMTRNDESFFFSRLLEKPLSTQMLQKTEQFRGAIFQNTPFSAPCKAFPSNLCVMGGGFGFVWIVA